MWMLVRLVALAVLAAGTVVLLGHAPALLELLDRVAGLVGAGPVPRDPGGLEPATRWLGLGAGVAVALLAARPVAHLVTLLHELGHTLVSAAAGARPSGIVLRHDASGHATARWVGRAGPARRLGLAVTAFVGMPAPVLATAVGAHLLADAGPRPVLWTLAGAGVVVAALARSGWTALSALALLGLAVAGLSEAARPWAEAAVVAALTATALTAGLDALRSAAAPIPPGDDALAVRRQLRLPARLVRLGQAAATLALAAWTLWLLTPTG